MMKALYEKQLEGINDINWEELEAKVVATIRICLDDDMMYHIMDEESLVSI
jgi:hypothetical protein